MKEDLNDMIRGLVRASLGAVKAEKEANPAC